MNSSGKYPTSPRDANLLSSVTSPCSPSYKAKLQKLLRRCKNTQQSIQSASHWMIQHTSDLNTMTEIWLALFTDENTDVQQQIVLLYVANDVLQVAARTLKKSMSECFESRLIQAAQHIMSQDSAGSEKVKRCLIKVVGIWQARSVIAAEPLVILQHICAGKDPADLLKPSAVDNDSIQSACQREKELFLQNILSESSIKLALEDMPEVIESEKTADISRRIQNLVSATITSDLLSDRMFQLESSISAFYQATEGDNIRWEAMDHSLFELDVEKSREHVQMFRENLETQITKREELMEALRTMDLESAETFQEGDTADLELMYDNCVKALIMEKEMQAKKKKDQSKEMRRHSASDLYAQERHTKRYRGYATPNGRQPRHDEQRQDPENHSTYRWEQAKPSYRSQY